MLGTGGKHWACASIADERLAGLSRSYLFEGPTLEELRPLAAVATTRELARAVSPRSPSAKAASAQEEGPG